MSDDKFYCEHPDPGKQGTRIDGAKYREMRRALHKLISRKQEGTLLSEVRAALPNELDGDIYAGASIGWYLMSVKLDLEARGEIERVPKASPQRLRRC